MKVVMPRYAVGYVLKHTYRGCIEVNAKTAADARAKVEALFSGFQCEIKWVRLGSCQGPVKAKGESA